VARLDVTGRLPHQVFCPPPRRVKCGWVSEAALFWTPCPICVAGGGEFCGCRSPSSRPRRWENPHRSARKLMSECAFASTPNARGLSHRVKTGVAGVAYVRLDEVSSWPKNKLKFILPNENFGPWITWLATFFSAKPSPRQTPTWAKKRLWPAASATRPIRCPLTRLRNMEPDALAGCMVGLIGPTCWQVLRYWVWWRALAVARQGSLRCWAAIWRFTFRSQSPVHCLYCPRAGGNLYTPLTVDRDSNFLPTCLAARQGPCW